MGLPTLSNFCIIGGRLLFGFTKVNSSSAENQVWTSSKGYFVHGESVDDSAWILSIKFPNTESSFLKVEWIDGHRDQKWIISSVDEILRKDVVQKASLNFAH